MAWIVVVDDEQRKAENIVSELGAAGYNADMVCRQFVGEFYDTIRVDKLPLRVWDAIIVDILFKKDRWGGVWVYNKLGQGGYRNRWKETIVYTKYASSNIGAATEGESLVLRVFADTVGIPYVPANNSVLPNLAGGREPLTKRLLDLRIV